MDLLEVGSIDELLDRVGPDVPSNLESYLADALVDGETWFFRERAALEAVAKRIACRLEQGAGPVSVWCAGGSSGQEAYSLAILLNELQLGETLAQVDILTSDIGFRATKRAQDGIYSHFEIQKGLSARRMITHFVQHGERDWQVSPTLRKQVEVCQHNLLDGPIASAAFDIVICRNVLAGMEEPHRSSALDSLKAGMKAGALLVLETEHDLASDRGFLPIETLGPGFYRSSQPGGPAHASH